MRKPAGSAAAEIETAPPADPAARIVVVAEDATFATWLQHSLGVAVEDAAVQACSMEDFRRRRASLTTRDCDLLVLVANFAAPASGEDGEPGMSEGLAWLRRLRDQPAFPAVLAIAEDGDELSAVRALRLGAADYLPRRLLTLPRLADAAGSVLREAAREAAKLAAAAAAAAALVAPAAAAKGEQATPVLPRNLIPRYTLVQKLGESERSTVYLARSAALNRNVALKVTRRGSEESSDFAREYEAISALSNPGIVEIYDYGMHEGREYLAMEYFPCGDLKARLQNPISEAQSLDYLRRMATALSVVHAAGIVHRDLKPPNVMLRESGQVVLIDFGIARALDGSRSTAAGMLRGSPYYMSPEQAQGLPLDMRSDLYSLGVIFYEMLTGQKPYLGATAMDVLQQHVFSELPELPRPLARHAPLLARLMAKSSADRFENVGALLQALGPA